MFYSRLYKAIKLIKNHIMLYIANKFPSYDSLSSIKTKIYVMSGLDIGAGTRISGPIVMDLSLGYDTFDCLKIGANCYININFRISTYKSNVKIGDECLIGPNVCIETASHTSNMDGIRRIPIQKHVVIEDNVWIGAGALILPGVKIGKDAIIAAGAVVNKDVLPRTMVGGVPAKVIRKNLC